MEESPDRFSYRELYLRIGEGLRAIDTLLSEWHISATTNAGKGRIQAFRVDHRSALDRYELNDDPTLVELSWGLVEIDTYLRIMTPRLEDCIRTQPNDSVWQIWQELTGIVREAKERLQTDLESDDPTQTVYRACREMVDQVRAECGRTTTVTGDLLSKVQQDLAAMIAATEKRCEALAISMEQGCATAVASALVPTKDVLSQLKDVATSLMVSCSSLQTTSFYHADIMVKMTTLMVPNAHAATGTALAAPPATIVAPTAVPVSASTMSTQPVSPTSPPSVPVPTPAAPASPTGPTPAKEPTVASASADIATKGSDSKEVLSALPDLGFDSEPFLELLSPQHRQITESLILGRPIELAGLQPEELIHEWDRATTVHTSTLAKGGRQALWARLAVEGFQRDLLARFNQRRTDAATRGGLN